MLCPRTHRLRGAPPAQRDPGQGRRARAFSTWPGQRRYPEQGCRCAAGRACRESRRRCRCHRNSPGSVASGARQPRWPAPRHRLAPPGPARPARKRVIDLPGPGHHVQPVPVHCWPQVAGEEFRAGGTSADPKAKREPVRIRPAPGLIRPRGHARSSGDAGARQVPSAAERPARR